MAPHVRSPGLFYFLSLPFRTGTVDRRLQQACAAPINSFTGASGTGNVVAIPVRCAGRDRDGRPNLHCYRKFNCNPFAVRNTFAHDRAD
jgi:hypothetical protein